MNNQANQLKLSHGSSKYDHNLARGYNKHNHYRPDKGQFVKFHYNHWDYHKFLLALHSSFQGYSKMGFLNKHNQFQKYNWDCGICRQNK
jgi:hypothetical protein